MMLIVHVMRRGLLITFKLCALESRNRRLGIYRATIPGKSDVIRPGFLGEGDGNKVSVVITVKRALLK